MNSPAMPPGGGRGMKFRKPFRPKTTKIMPARYRAIAEAVLIAGFSFWIGSHSMASSVLISIQLMRYTSEGFRFFMTRGFQGTDHGNLFFSDTRFFESFEVVSHLVHYGESWLPTERPGWKGG